MDMRLRKATPDDAQPVALLWHELIRTHLDYDPHFEVKADAAGGFADHIRQAANETTTLLGVAEDNSRLVGFIHASILKRPPCFTVSHQGQVWDLLVRPECRRQGVGRGLVQMALRFFRDNGVEFADVRVASQNAPAIAFWNSMGMQPYITVGKLKP